MYGDHDRFPHSVRVEYTRRWNDITAWVLDHIGLPGDRYVADFDTDFLQFHFRSVKDQLLFLIAWGQDEF